MKVGFIGLGNIGLPMAQRIQSAGHELVVWARNEASLRPFAGSTPTIASSPAEMGALVDSVGICVFDAAGVDRVLFGPDGVAEGLKPAAVIVVHSTVSAREAVQLEAKAAALGFRLLEAPVSGGAAGASNGTLTVMVGGDPQALDEVSDMLAAFSDHVVHLGAIGCGSRAKLINNAIFTAQIVVADYAMKAGETLGLDSSGLADVLSRSSSACIGSDVRIRAGSLAGIAGRPADYALVKDIAILRSELGRGGGNELFEITDVFVDAMATAHRTLE